MMQHCESIPKSSKQKLQLQHGKKKNTRLGHLSAIESWSLFLASGRKLSKSQQPRRLHLADPAKSEDFGGTTSWTYVFG